jgi:hypothetical protein
MPFGEYKDFADCVRANADKQSPEGYCAEIHKKITGEYPSAAKKGMTFEDFVFKTIEEHLNDPSKPDIPIADVEAIFAAVKTLSGPTKSFREWAGNEPGNFDACVKKLTDAGVYGGDAEKISGVCAKMHKEAMGKWPAEKGMGLEGPIVVKEAAKQIAIAPVLVPGEPDSDGEILTAEKIEAVAYGFMEDFGIVDVSHTLAQVGKPVSSEILRHDETFILPSNQRLTLPKGTWMLGARVKHPETWKGIMSGAFKGFSVMGVRRKDYEAATKGQAIPEAAFKRRILFKDLGEDWIGVAVSVIKNPAVLKSKWVALKSADTGDGILNRMLNRILNINKSGDTPQASTKNKEGMDMEKEEVKKMVEDMLAESLPKVIAATISKLGKPDKEEVVDPATRPAETNTDSGKPPEAPAPPPALVTAPPAAPDVAAEITALKGQVADQQKLVTKMTELLAARSQALKGADAVPAVDPKTDRVPDIKRDPFGRRVA